jgi:hypothetical protein
MDASNRLQNGTAKYLSLLTATDLPGIAGYTTVHCAIIVPSLTADTNTNNNHILLQEL